MSVVSNLLAVFLIGGLVLSAGVFMFWIQTNDLNALYDYNQDLYHFKVVSNGFDAALQTTVSSSGHSLQYGLGNLIYYYPLRSPPVPKDQFNYPDIYDGQDNFTYVYADTTRVLNEAFGNGNWYLRVQENPEIKLGDFKSNEKRIAIKRFVPLPEKLTGTSSRFAQVILWVYEVKE